MAGTLTISTLSDGTNSTSTTNCIQGSAKAWVNFNGTTSPGTIRASYNVSSVTKNGTGDYTLNFTNALADANYSIVGMTTGYGASDNAGVTVTVAGSLYTTALLYTASAVRISAGRNSTPLDGGVICCSVFR